MKEVFHKLRGTKMYVPSTEFSKLQEVLFEIGFKWITGKQIATDRRPFIFLNYDGIITWDDDFESYNNKIYDEIYPFEVFKLRREYIASKLKGTKVFVANKDISTKVQEKLLELGFRYISELAEINSVNMPFLYIENNGFIDFGASFDTFKSDKNKEVYVNEIIEIKR